MKGDMGLLFCCYALQVSPITYCLSWIPSLRSPALPDRQGKMNISD